MRMPPFRNEFGLDVLFSDERLEEDYYALYLPDTNQELSILVIPRTGLWIADDQEIAAIIGISAEEYQNRLILEYGARPASALRSKYPHCKQLKRGAYFDDREKALRAVRDLLMPAHLAAKMAGTIREAEQ